MSIGKRTAITESVNLTFAFDFFNVFNKVDYAVNAATFLDLNTPRAFGVLTQQFVPPDRTAGSRWIQFGLRVEF